MKERLDKILVSKGLVKSRDMARALIIEGKVLVNGEKITKPGTSINNTSQISLIAESIPYVSRGGLKLEAALLFFNIPVEGKVVIDAGSGTGGFTDCLLKMGAKKVYCIDVGYGQLAWSLRKDPRVVIMERFNIRYLDKILREQGEKYEGAEFDDLKNRTIDMVTIDVSFISLKKVVPAVTGFIKEGGEILTLVKPQFEVGKGETGKGGIVREVEKRLKSVESVRVELEQIGLRNIGMFQSPIKGRKGNIEYFLYFKKADQEDSIGRTKTA
ncbi:MAG: TlyA family RNA methyltransferase [Nitrospirae bacterium]|nr:TlyA family RNA methyltransferase [Nitrospirota bacterium]